MIPLSLDTVRSLCSKSLYLPFQARKGGAFLQIYALPNENQILLVFLTFHLKAQFLYLRLHCLACRAVGGEVLDLCLDLAGQLRAFKH